MTGNSTVQAVLTVIEDDVLSAAGSPLLTFLNAQTAAAGDPFKEIAAWAQFRGSLIGSLPNLEGTLIAQIDNVIIAKVQAAMAKVAAATKPVATAVQGAGIAAVG